MTHHAGSIRRIALTTDLGPESPDTFAQALALAVRSRAELFLVHVAHPEQPAATWHRLPTVRELLERWQMLPKDASHQAFERLGVKVHAVERSPSEGDLRAAVTRRVTEVQPDLLIVAPHGRSGVDLLSRSSVSEPVARDVRRPTLFLPAAARPLVEVESGVPQLHRVVVALGPGPTAHGLVAGLEQVLTSLGAGPTQFTVVHVGAFSSLPDLALPTRTDWMWKTDLRSGHVVDQLLQACVDHEADLLVMGTEGHDSLFDVLLGSTVERVVRRTSVPVLALPV